MGDDFDTARAKRKAAQDPFEAARAARKAAGTSTLPPGWEAYAEPVDGPVGAPRAALDDALGLPVGMAKKYGLNGPVLAAGEQENPIMDKMGKALEYGIESIAYPFKAVGERGLSLLEGATIAASVPLVDAVNHNGAYQLERAKMAFNMDPELANWPSPDPLLESVTLSGAPGLDPALAMEGLPRLVTALGLGRKLTVPERMAVADAIPGVTRVTPEGGLTVAGKETTLAEVVSHETPLVTDTAPALAKEIPAPAAPPIDRPLHEMTREELDHLHGVLSANEKDIEIAIFGKEGAEKYKRLSRRANSTTIPRSESKAAWEEMDRMEAALTEHERNRLFGIDEGGPSAEQVNDYRKALYSIGPEDSLDELARSVARTAGMDENIARARMNEIGRILKERGVSLEELKRPVMEQMTARFGGDAPSMWESLVRKVVPEPKSPTPLTIDTAPALRGADEAVSTASGGAKGPPTPPVAAATPLPPDPEGVAHLVDRPTTALGPTDQAWQDFLRKDLPVPYADKELRIPFTDKTVTPQEMYDFYKRGSMGAIAGQDYDQALKTLAAKKYAARLHSVEEAIKTKDALAALDGPELRATFEAMRAGDPIPEAVAAKIGPNFFATNDAIRANRRWSMENGMLGESSFNEFPDWFQVIYEKKAIESASKKGGFAKGIGFRLDPKMARENGYGLVLEMNLDEAKALVGDRKTKFLAPISKSEVYVKFPNNAEGEAAAQSIYDAIPKDQPVTIEGRTFYVPSKVTYRHGPLSDAARAELGEVTDIPALLGNAYYRTAADKAKGEFLLGVRDNPKWTTTVPVKDILKNEDLVKSQLKEAGYELVPDSKGWGPLRGNGEVRYAVRTEQMAPLNRMLEEQGFIEKGIRGTMKGWVKNALTTMGAASRNILTNQAYAFAHGMNPFSGNSVGRQLKAADAFLGHLHTGVMDDTTRYLVDNGIMMGSPSEQLGAYAETYRNIFKDYGAASDVEKAWENAFDAVTGSPLGEATMRVPLTDKTIPAGGVRAITGAVQGGVKAAVSGSNPIVGMALGAGKNIAYGQKIPGLGLSGVDAIRIAWQGGDPILKHALFEFHVDAALAKGLPIEKAREFALYMVKNGTQNYAIQTGGFTEATRALGFPFMAFKEADREIKTFLLSQGPAYAARTSAVMWQKKLARAATAGIAAAMGYDMLKWAQTEKQYPDTILVPTGKGTFEAVSDDYLLTDAFEIPDFTGDSGLGHPLLTPLFNIASIHNAEKAGDVSKAVSDFHGMPLVKRGETAAEAELRQIQDMAPLSPGGRINRLMEDTMSKEYRNQSGTPFTVPRTTFQLFLSRIDPGTTVPPEGADYTPKEQALLMGFQGRMRALVERHAFDQKDINLGDDTMDADGLFVNPKRRKMQIRLLHDTVDLIEDSRKAGVPLDPGPLDEIKALLFKVEGGDVGLPIPLKVR